MVNILNNSFLINSESVTIYDKKSNIGVEVSLTSFKRIEETCTGIFVKYDGTVKNYYAYARTLDNKLKLLHRQITECPSEFQVDHIDHNTLNNTDKNLRIVTQVKNQLNRNGCQSNSKSGIRGVCWDKKRKRWKAQIQINKKKKYLGEYKTMEQARDAYSLALLNCV